jgi:hypothetical protein
MRGLGTSGIHRISLASWVIVTGKHLRFFRPASSTSVSRQNALSRKADCRIHRLHFLAGGRLMPAKQAQRLIDEIHEIGQHCA